MNQEYFGMTKSNKEIPGFYNLMEPEDNEKYKRLECEHEFIDIESPPDYQSGWHVDICVKCSIKRGYDTSD